MNVSLASAASSAALSQRAKAAPHAPKFSGWKSALLFPPVLLGGLLAAYGSPLVSEFSGYGKVRNAKGETVAVFNNNGDVWEREGLLETPFSRVRIGRDGERTHGGERLMCQGNADGEVVLAGMTIAKVGEGGVVTATNGTEMGTVEENEQRLITRAQLAGAACQLFTE